MIAAYNDWEGGHTPVTTGQAPWLPMIFVQAVHAVRDAVSELRAENAAAARARAGSGMTPLARRGKR